MKKVFKLEDLDCAHCANKMEVGIKKTIKANYYCFSTILYYFYYRQNC